MSDHPAVYRCDMCGLDDPIIRWVGVPRKADRHMVFAFCRDCIEETLAQAAQHYIDASMEQEEI